MPAFEGAVDRVLARSRRLPHLRLRVPGVRCAAERIGMRGAITYAGLVQQISAAGTLSCS
jgi:hypothetical protein